MQETLVQFLGWKNLLEKEMAMHSSILTWKIPWTEEPGGLQSMGSQRVGHDWETSLHFHFPLQASPERVLAAGDWKGGELGKWKGGERDAGERPGQGSCGGCCCGNLRAVGRTPPTTAPLKDGSWGLCPQAPALCWARGSSTFPHFWAALPSDLPQFQRRPWGRAGKHGTRPRHGGMLSGGEPETSTRAASRGQGGETVLKGPSWLLKWKGQRWKEEGPGLVRILFNAPPHYSRIYYVPTVLHRTSKHKGSHDPIN